MIEVRVTVVTVDGEGDHSFVTNDTGDIHSVTKRAKDKIKLMGIEGFFINRTYYPAHQIVQIKYEVVVK